MRIFRDESVQRLFFSHYPTYAFGVLRDYAVGSAANWKDAYVRGAPYLTVPLGSIAAFSAVAYGVFRFRNITA
jgi:hypothetical protein